MAARGQVRLEVTFGPSRSQRFASALERAVRAGVDLTEVEPGRFRAVFSLEHDPASFASAWALVSQVGSMGACEVDVDEAPESARDVVDMTDCARRWLRARGSCRQLYPSGEPFARCLVCPLYSPERLTIRPGSWTSSIDVEIPDTLPDDWR